ncbi:MAG TPA: (2Fe-2S)-binding protein [Desulfomonilaceae bacterium]|nr:(2Fe-2S)-binding protein [Desulfomonilaceae bacterium]
MKTIIELNINDEVFEMVIEPRTTLLEVLREHLAFTGTKEACGTGECGACTVLIEGKPKLACLTLAAECANTRITTIEGLVHDGQLTPVQQAFLEKGAVQCGFCTPAMVLTATALLEENPNPTEYDIKKALEGNLCRCTGYNKIMEAIREAAKSGESARNRK